MTKLTKCRVPKCGNWAYCIGLCGGHYNNHLREARKGKSSYEKYIVRKKNHYHVRSIRVSTCHCGEAFVEGVGCGRCRYESRRLIRNGRVA